MSDHTELTAILCKMGWDLFDSQQGVHNSFSPYIESIYHSPVTEAVGSTVPLRLGLPIKTSHRFLSFCLIDSNTGKGAHETFIHLHHRGANEERQSLINRRENSVTFSLSLSVTTLWQKKKTWLNAYLSSPVMMRFDTSINLDNQCSFSF